MTVLFGDGVDGDRCYPIDDSDVLQNVSNVKKQKVIQQQWSNLKKQPPILEQESIIVHRGPIYLIFDE